MRLALLGLTCPFGAALGLIPRASASGLDTLNTPPTRPFPLNLGTHIRPADGVPSFDALHDLSAAGTAASSSYRAFRPAMSFRRDGGMNSFTFSIRAENGSDAGQRVIVGYDHFSDRSTPNGGEIALTSAELLGGHWSSLIQYRYSQDLREATAGLSHQFADAPLGWAASVSADYCRTALLQYGDGAFNQQVSLNQERLISWIALSRGSSTMLQTAAAYVRLRRSSVTFSVFPTDNVDFLIGSVSLLHRTYRTAAFLDNFGRPENIPVGCQVGAAYGVDLHHPQQRNISFTQIFGRVSFSIGGSLFTSAQASLESYLLNHVPGPGVVSVQTLHYWKILRSQTLVARFKAVLGSHWDPVNFLLLGSSTGLRGYRNDEFYGQRLLLVNVEHRIFAGPRLWLFKVGAALFCDSGLAWWQEEPFSRHRFHNSAGLGLRLENLKAAGSAVLRLDAAYNFDLHRISFIVSSDLLFRTLSSMQFIEPVPGRTALN